MWIFLKPCHSRSSSHGLFWKHSSSPSVLSPPSVFPSCQESHRGTRGHRSGRGTSGKYPCSSRRGQRESVGKTTGGLEKHHSSAPHFPYNIRQQAFPCFNDTHTHTTPPPPIRWGLARVAFQPNMRSRGVVSAVSLRPAQTRHHIFLIISDSNVRSTTHIPPPSRWGLARVAFQPNMRSRGVVSAVSLRPGSKLGSKQLIILSWVAKVFRLVAAAGLEIEGVSTALIVGCRTAVASTDCLGMCVWNTHTLLHTHTSNRDIWSQRTVSADRQQNTHSHGALWAHFHHLTNSPLYRLL